MSISDTGIKKPKTVLIFTLIFVALGLYTFNKLPIDLLPNLSLPYVMVVTNYENASPEEVEAKVTKTMEGTFSGITGLKTIQSSSTAGSSLITMEFSQSTNLDQATNMIRDRLSLIQEYLPSGVSSPMILQLDTSMMPIMAVSLTGNKSPDELLNIATDIVKPNLEQLDGVASANLSGGREKAIKIEVPLEKLEALNLSLSQISQVIAAQNWKSDAGVITDHGMSYSISSEGNFTSVEEIKNIVISTKTTDPNKGNVAISQVKLGDIANVYEGYKDATSYAYINGKSGVLLTIQKQSGTNSLQVAQKVKAELKDLTSILPDGSKIDVAFDTTQMITTSVSNVTSSAMYGIILAIIVILFFLRSISSTFIIALTIPISLIITFLIMYFTNHTINMMSLAGLTLGVGMLVDNSIVILENIYRYRDKGAKAHIAASLGSNEMRSAITSSTLTTICVYIPLLLFRDSMNGTIRIFEDLAFTVIIALSTSLIVALILVPTLSSSFFKGRHIKPGEKRRGFNGLVEKMFKSIEKGYSNFIRWCLHHKILFIFIILSLFGLSIYQIPKLGFIFIPETDQTSVVTDLEFPHGTSLAEIDSQTKVFEQMLEDKLPGVLTISTSIGGSGIAAAMSGSNSSTAELTITLKDAAQRTIGDLDAKEAEKVILKLGEEYPGINVTTSVQSAMGMQGMGSSAVDVTLKCNDFDRLKAVSNQIVKLLENEGTGFVYDVSNSIVEGNPQLSIVYDRAALDLNHLTTMGVANELKANLNGQIVGRYTDKGNDIDMVISLTDVDNYHRINLDQMTVTNMLGQKVPLSAVAHLEESVSPMSISREDQARVAHITAKQVAGLSSNEVNKQVTALLTNNINTDESLTFSVGGEWEQMQEGIEIFSLIILMASILVFGVMASQFESFKDPFIVIFTLPMALIGIVGILTLMNSTISLMTLVGALVLVGVIVNNGIVLVDYTNLLRKRGRNLEDACAEAAQTRLRPVMMTTLTTVLALVPMSFFPQEGSQLIQPIGQVVFGGLTFGTLMTLTMMPIIYYIFNARNEKKKVKLLAKRKEQSKLIIEQELEDK